MTMHVAGIIRFDCHNRLNNNLLLELKGRLGRVYIVGESPEQHEELCTIPRGSDGNSLRWTIWEDDNLDNEIGCYCVSIFGDLKDTDNKMNKMNATLKYFDKISAELPVRQGAISIMFINKSGFEYTYVYRYFGGCFTRCYSS